VEFEYKHVQFDFGLLGAFDRQMYDARLKAVLNENGAQGWDLKGCFHDFGYHAHLVFGRPVEREVQAKVRPEGARSG
jgi:hypothetical protein